MGIGIKRSVYFECIPLPFFSLYHLSFYTTSPLELGLCSLLCFHSAQHNGAQNLIEAFWLSCNVNIYQRQQSITPLVVCRGILYICYFPGDLLIIVPKGWCPMLEQLEMH